MLADTPIPALIEGAKDRLTELNKEIETLTAAQELLTKYKTERNRINKFLEILERDESNTEELKTRGVVKANNTVEKEAPVSNE